MIDLCLILDGKVQFDLRTIRLHNVVISLVTECLLRCRLDVPAMDLSPKRLQWVSMGISVLLNLLNRVLKSWSCHNSWMSLLALHEVTCFHIGGHNLHVASMLLGHYVTICTHSFILPIIVFSFVDAWLLHNRLLNLFLSDVIIPWSTSFPVTFSFFDIFSPDFHFPYINPVIIINLCNRWVLSTLYFKSYGHFKVAQNRGILKWDT